MPELICNTSPLQYLHQLDRLSLLPRLAGSVIVPDAVAAELAAGRAQGVELPDPTRLDEGKYVTEVEVELIESDDNWAP